MTVTMDADSRRELVGLIRSFAVIGKRRTLKEFQRVAGHINWALNVFPLLKPGLSALYAKTAGKERDLALLRVNAPMVFELNWVSYRVEHSSGVHLLKSVEWDPRCADSIALTVFTDASAVGMAYYIPSLSLAFQCPIPANAVSEHIFFFEALAGCSVFHFVSSLPLTPNRLVIYSDNTNTVDIFNSLRAIAPYNRLLISAMSLVLDHEIDFQVLHVRGIDNPVANALSRFKNDLAVSICPGLVIQTFQPPQDATGAAPK